MQKARFRISVLHNSIESINYRVSMRMHFTIIQNTPFLKKYMAEKYTVQVNAPALYIYSCLLGDTREEQTDYTKCFVS